MQIEEEKIPDDTTDEVTQGEELTEKDADMQDVKEEVKEEGKTGQTDAEETTVKQSSQQEVPSKDLENTTMAHRQ